MEESPVIKAVRQKVQEWIDAGNSVNSVRPLNLVNMNITELPADIFTGCMKLRNIFLEWNYLIELPAGLFTGCSELRTVYLDNNKLTELPAGLFTGCSELNYVSLNNNKLTKLPANLFVGCSKLAYIGLNNSTLTELPAGLFIGCSILRNIWFNESLIYHILWSLPDIDIAYIACSYVKLKTKFPIEYAYVRRCRRVSNDPRSYAWDVRRHVIISIITGSC